MATVKALIRRNKINQQGECVVFLRYGHKQKTVDISTGIKVFANLWHEKKELVNEAGSIPKTKVNEELLKIAKQNDLLTNTKIKEEKSKVMSIVRYIEIKGEDPEVHTVKESYRKDQSKVERNLKEERLQDLWSKFISLANKSENTKEKYRNALYHLYSFESEKNEQVRIKNINLKFYDRFVHYLYNEFKKPDGTTGLADNTVGTTIKNLKVLLNHLIKRGYPISNIVGELKAPKITNPVIFLTECELEQLKSFEFESERLTKVRDVFVFNCYTGLRYSDLSRLDKSHIKENAIELRAYKNQKDIYVPLTSVAKEILQKYDFQLPIVSEQKFNEYIKEVSRIAGISENVELIVTKSGNKSYSMIPKHNVITSHIAIKTFISLCGKKGISPKIVSEITGKSVQIILKH
jgi:site-specific recombinase XerD